MYVCMYVCMYVGEGDSKSSEPHSDEVGETKQFFTIFQRDPLHNALGQAKPKNCNSITEEACIQVHPNLLHRTYDHIIVSKMVTTLAGFTIRK